MRIRGLFGGFLSLTIFTLISTLSATNAVEFDLLDGDHITCVDIRKQISFLHRNASDVHYQRHPSREVKPSATAYDHSRVKRSSQLLQLESSVFTNKACPPGTIPVRQNRGSWFSDDYDYQTSQVDHGSSQSKRLRAERARRFDMNQKYSTSAPVAPTDAAFNFTGYNWTVEYNLTGFNFTENSTLTPHEYGVARLNTSRLGNAEQKFKGIEGAFNIWAPFVATEGEFSLGQLWLTAGSYKTHDLNTIEVGFQVSFGAYGDLHPRLFIFWTRDAYNGTGCYNLNCPGFVQVSSSVLVGGSFANVSQTNGTQYEITLRVFKDDESGNWWLKLNDENVGYWPKSLFTRLSDVADNMSWGGEIVDDQPHSNNHHTDTDMGSGEFADAGFTRSAFVRTLQYVDLNNTLQDALINVDATDPGCYTIKVGDQFKDWGSYFYYGGEGFSSSCLSNRNLPHRQ